MHALLETLQQAILRKKAPIPRGFLKKNARLAPRKQINIYAYAYKERLLGILQEDYPQLCERLGIRKFRRLAGSYLNDHPPQTHRLAQYSIAFGPHLKRKHNLLPEHLLALAAAESAELQLLEMPSLPPFRPKEDSTPETLLTLPLTPQPAALFVRDKLLYRVGTQILEQPMSAPEYAAFRKLSDTPSLERWISHLSATEAAQAPQWLGHWIAQNMLCLGK